MVACGLLHALARISTFAQALPGFIRARRKLCVSSRAGGRSERLRAGGNAAAACAAATALRCQAATRRQALRRAAPRCAGGIIRRCYLEDGGVQRA